LNDVVSMIATVRALKESLAESLVASVSK
jgi:hypothetical protein